MHAVLIEVDVAGVARDECLKGLREKIVPAITALPGFQSGIWLTGNENGLGLSLTVWNTKEHAQDMAAMFGPGSSPQAGASIRRDHILKQHPRWGFTQDGGVFRWTAPSGRTYTTRPDTHPV